MTNDGRRRVTNPDPTSLTSNQKLVAYTLAVYMDADGSNCYVGTDKLAAAAMLGKKKVLGCLEVLAAKGYLHIEKRGGRLSNRYAATLPAVSVVEPQIGGSAVPKRELAVSDLELHRKYFGVPLTGLAVPDRDVVVSVGEPNHHTTTPQGGGGGGELNSFGGSADAARLAASTNQTAMRQWWNKHALIHAPAGVTINELDKSLAQIVALRLTQGWDPDELARRGFIDWPNKIKNSATGVLRKKLEELPDQPIAPLRSEDRLPNVTTISAAIGKPKLTTKGECIDALEMLVGCTDEQDDWVDSRLDAESALEIEDQLVRYIKHQLTEYEETENGANRLVDAEDECLLSHNANGWWCSICSTVSVRQMMPVISHVRRRRDELLEKMFKNNYAS